MSNSIGQLQMLLTAMAGGQAPLARFRLRLPWRLGRLALLAATAFDLLRIVFRPHAVIITGPNLAHLQGKLTIASDRVVGRGLRSLLSGQPAIVIPFGTEGNPLARLCRVIGFDPSSEIHALLSINAILVLFGMVDGRPAVAHYATIQSALMAVERHRAGLTGMAAGNLLAEVKSLSPTVISWARDQGGAVLLQRRLNGIPGKVTDVDEETFRRQIDRALILLLSIDGHGRMTGSGPDSGFISEKLLSLPDALPARYATALAPAIGMLQEWPGRLSLRSVPVHGDYWLPNLMFDEAGEIAGLIDWEWYRDDGLPLFDAFHLLFVSTALRRGLHLADLVPQVWVPATREPWIGEVLERLSQATGIAHEDQVRIAIVLWLSVIRRSHVDTGPRADAWLERAIAEPARLLHSHVLEQEPA